MDVDIVELNAGNVGRARLEQYLFCRLSRLDFEDALRTLGELHRYRRPEIRMCLLRDSVISYARPFSANRGLHSRGRRLNVKLVPKALRALHTELMALRNQLFAHTDFEYRRPFVERWALPDRVIFGLGVRNFDYISLNRRANDIETLVRAVQSNLLGMIVRAEHGFPRAVAPSN